MTSEEKKEWDDFKAGEIPKLEAELKDVDPLKLNTMEDIGKYWHKRIMLLVYLTEFGQPHHDLECMKLALECLEKTKHFPKAYNHWREYWFYSASDISAHSWYALTPPDYAKWARPAIGKEKEAWEEVDKLLYKYWCEFPTKL